MIKVKDVSIIGS